MTMQNELTKKEQKVLTEIVDFIALNKYPPSVRELSALTGFSLNSTHGYIERLVEKGFLYHEKGKNRSLRIVGKPSQPIEQERERLIELICESTQTEECIAHCNHPPVGDDVLCYDYARGLVYSGFIREDGNVQLRINPEGNLVIVSIMETAESKIIRNDGEGND